MVSRPRRRSTPQSTPRSTYSGTSSLARAAVRPVDFIAATTRLICQEPGGEIEATDLQVTVECVMQESLESIEQNVLKGSKSQAVSGTRAGALNSVVFVMSLKGYNTPFYPAWNTVHGRHRVCTGRRTNRGSSESVSGRHPHAIFQHPSPPLDYRAQRHGRRGQPSLRANCTGGH
eukprot:4675772-Amphidinium_carterae.2